MSRTEDPEEEARLALVAAASRYASLPSVTPAERNGCKHLVTLVAQGNRTRERRP